MKKLTHVCSKLMLALLLIIPLSSTSQIEVKWNKTLSSTIQWQEVSALGNLMVCSKDGLMGIDTETGEVIWTRAEHANLARGLYRELPNSPFFTVNTNKTIHLINQFSGIEVFNSTEAGIDVIIDYFLLYNSDAILVAGENEVGEPIMLSVKMSDGRISWTMNEKFGRIIATTELDNNELLIVTLFNNYKLNVDNGDIIWKNVNSKEASQIQNMGAFGELLMGAAEKMSEDMDIQLKYFKQSESDIFYLGSEQKQQSSMSSSSGEPSYSYTNQYNAFNISDGSLVWDESLEVKGKLSQLAFLDNGLLILPDDGNKTKINLFDYESHTGQWGKKGKGISIKGGIYDYLKSNDGILLVSRTASKDYLNYLDPVAGAITFEKPVKVDGSVVGIVPLSNSILYITSESMNILDQGSGALKWKKSINTRPNLTSQHDGKIYAFDLKTGTIKVVDMETEKVSDLSSRPIEFQGKEIPRKLEVMNNGIFLHSDQNVAKVGFDGSLLYNSYYPAPRESGWKRALLYAEAVRAAYIAAESYYVSGSMAAAEEDVRAENEVAGEMVSQIGDAYEERGDLASSYAGDAFRQANARKKATKSGRNFMFIMSKQEKEILLLKISKSTGAVDGEIKLGKDREPIYAVDDVTGQVYYVSQENTLVSYQVK